MGQRTRTERQFAPGDTFVRRHVGPSDAEVKDMLTEVGVDSLDALMDEVVPESIRLRSELSLEGGWGESELLAYLEKMASQNEVYRSLIGMGYADCITPGVILRNILENPGWYTQYTPYQAEISQGRMEALINFQTMVSDLTGLPLANASMLDEATAAAEAMAMSYAIARRKKQGFFVAQDCHPQTIAVVQTRAEPLGIELHIGDPMAFDFAAHDLFGVLLQYPGTDGQICDYGAVIEKAHEAGALVTMAAELMALALIKAPGEWGADIAVGSTQRFGVPLGFGGPHAAYMSTKMEHRRQMPGRLIGASKDVHGKPGYRLALQTREQHIRRDRATSNICTSQVLLAVIAGMYAVYHGPEGIKGIATRIHEMTSTLAEGLKQMGHTLKYDTFFDTLRVSLSPEDGQRIYDAALAARINLRKFDDGDLGLTLDETCGDEVLEALFGAFAAAAGKAQEQSLGALAEASQSGIPASAARTSEFLTHEVFHQHKCEHDMLRYIFKLQNRDLSLTHSMIPLGSCTMKLNSSTEMVPVTWPAFGKIHPFAPTDQWKGYKELFTQLEDQLAEITGFAAVSLQPNAGSQGEYTGLLAIRAYHMHRGDTERNVCLIPTSAHGTNPASAVMAGMKVVPIATSERGDIDIEDLRKKAEQHKEKLSALMVTYPSTHGVFEEGIKEICEIIHEQGGLVYMDGANMNAQVGLCTPGDIGADVCHLNLHKTFCLAEGTPVTLADGTTRPIEALLVGERVMAWSEEEQGIEAAPLEAGFFTGEKECVEVVFQDGRAITCTPDHRILTTDGWVEAGQLDTAKHRVVVGSEAVSNHPGYDEKVEHAFCMEAGPLVLSMKTSASRNRTLAFFRLLGAVMSDGTHSREKKSGRVHIRLNLGTMLDAQKAVEDIALLTGIHPAISRCRRVFSVRIPKELTEAFQAVDGFGDPGRRVESSTTLPAFVGLGGTPKAVLREFLGALFGGDGCAPTIVHLKKNPNTLKEVQFCQSRTDRSVLMAFFKKLQAALARLGVESTIGKPCQPANTKQASARWSCHLTVVWGSAFAEQVGFRYSAHKSARLSAATAWWRMKESILEQKREVAQRTLDHVASLSKSTRGPKPVWEPALAAAYAGFASEHDVLNPYFTSFQGFAKLIKQHFVQAIEGQKGTRGDIRHLRRTHRRAKLPSMNRKGEPTGMPTLDSFFEELGVSSWFNTHTPGGKGYSVTYATNSQEDLVEPVMSLSVVSVRPVGQRKVYDLTVTGLHSFMANGVVVHNCIPHGGGGPGMGPIGVNEKLKPFLPGHPVVPVGGEHAIGPVSAAPYGSPSILPISWVYIALMGAKGLKHATQVAILSANYMATRLKDHYDVLYTGPNDRVAHEFVLDVRPFKADTGVEVVDVAKRLMDYGFHAPTMSWPVPGTLMVEPTESESKAELDRFCEAMIAIRQEIQDIADGKGDKENNPLKNAPHPLMRFVSEEWPYPYTRQQAAFPKAWVQENKFWPAVARIDDAYGDRNLVCTCLPMEAYED